MGSWRMSSRVTTVAPDQIGHRKTAVVGFGGEREAVGEPRLAQRARHRQRGLAPWRPTTQSVARTFGVISGTPITGAEEVFGIGLDDRGRYKS